MRRLFIGGVDPDSKPLLHPHQGEPVRHGFELVVGHVTICPGIHMTE